MKQFPELDPRFQHLGLKVGSFLVLLIVLLAVMGGVLLWRQDLFVPNAEFHARPDRADAIRPGMDVTLRGIRVGSVTKVRLGKDGIPEMTFRIHKESLVWIYADARVRLIGLDFFNTPNLAILPGDPLKGAIKDGAMLKFEREMTVGEIASKLEEAVSPLIAEAANLLGELKRPEGDLFSSLASLKTFSSALEEQVPGLLEESRKAATSTRILIEDMAAESGDVRVSAARVQAITAELEKRLPRLLDHTERTLSSTEKSAKIVEQTLAESSEDVRLTVRKSGAAAEKADTLVEDVRNIWLLKLFLPRQPRQTGTPDPN